MNNSFKNLQFWKTAHELTLLVYKVTWAFPEEEKFGLTSQLRRGSISVAANIAEGYRKRTKPDKLKFFNISHGSLDECRYYFILSRDLGYINNYSELESKATEISKSLTAYSKKIKSSM